MNIKQAEQQSGVPRQNIRFYEKEGLLRPARNPENDYRDYSADDVRTLKLIRTLRMLDMPLPEIRKVLVGELPLPQAAAAQQQRLEVQAKELAVAIRFCGDLQQQRAATDTLDVDAVLAELDTPEARSGVFAQWVQDYKQLAKAAHEQQFVFYPDGAVTNARELTDALFAYANENHLDLVITEESMHPVFTLDGVEYRATRRYTNMRGIPVAVVRCAVTHPEDFEPDMAPVRKKWLKLLHYAWPVLALLAFAVLILAPRGLLLNPWALALMLALGTAAISGTVYNFYYFYNENGKKGRRKKE